MKTALTKKIERQLFDYSGAGGLGVYGAFEVAIGEGYGNEFVDYITLNSKGEIRCYEIKITKQDFHSKNKLSFYGDYNYLVMPVTMYKEVEDEIPYGIGVLLYYNTGLFELVKRPKKKNIPPWQHYMLTHCMVRSLSRLTKKFLTETETE